MKHALYLLLVTFSASVPVFAAGLLEAASNVVHGATDIATDATDTALTTAGNVFSPRRAAVVVEEEPIVDSPLDFEDDISNDVDTLVPEDRDEYQRPFMD